MSSFLDTLFRTQPANALVTTGANVDISAAGPPVAGYVLKAVDATHAIWMPESGGSGLSNVTNDAQLKRAAHDFDTFPARSVPTSNDLVLLEKSTDGSKCYASLSAIQSPLVAFNVATDINPAHWYRGDNTSQSGGLVDTILDAGSVAKNFTQTGAARCPTAVDGAGKTYLAPDGVTDFYTAGALADWKFLNDGSPWTVALVYHRTAGIVGQESLIDNTDHSTGGTGFSIFQLFASATVQGPALLVTSSVGGAAPLTVESLTLSTALSVLIVRHTGDNTSNANGGISPTPVDAVMRRMGALVSLCSRKNTFASTNPSYPMTLFRRANTADRFTSSRFYDLVIDNKAWSDRQVFGYEAYAKAQYGVAV